MIISITGHRPQKCGGFKTPNPTFNQICRKIEFVFKEKAPEKIIAGMALGVDTYAAKIAVKLDIPFIAAVPFKNQEKMWPKESQEEYHKLLEKAEKIVVVSPGSYLPEKMQIRNEWIVDNSDMLLGVWDGTRGGTKNCLDYAKNKKHPLIIIRIDRKFEIENVLY